MHFGPKGEDLHNLNCFISTSSHERLIGDSYHFCTSRNWIHFEKWPFAGLATKYGIEISSQISTKSYRISPKSVQFQRKTVRFQGRNWQFKAQRQSNFKQKLPSLEQKQSNFSQKQSKLEKQTKNVWMARYPKNCFVSRLFSFG